MDTIATGSAADRRDLFTETGSRRGLPPAIIEKDFWVCWILKQVSTLEEIGPNLIFKGGTSLSKVFGLIQRFSEDIDLSIRRDYLGFEGDTDPEKAASRTKQRERVLSLRETCRACVQGVLLPALTERLTGLLGREGWSLMPDGEDPGTLDFVYPSAAPVRRGRQAFGWAMPSYLRRSVKLEFGAGSDPYPVGNYPITPFAAEVFPQLFAEPRFPVTVLEAERTFWEKATLAHAEYHRPAGSPTPLRISRHYYDLYQLASSDHGRRALSDRHLLQRVAEHKRVYFASGWAHYETAPTGGLRLVPPVARQKEIAHDYEQMRDYFFGPFSTLEQVMENAALSRGPDQFPLGSSTEWPRLPVRPKDAWAQPRCGSRLRSRSLQAAVRPQQAWDRGPSGGAGSPSRFRRPPTDDSEVDRTTVPPEAQDSRDGISEAGFPQE